MAEKKLLALIPPSVQLEWLDKHGVEFWNPEHKEETKRLLNLPEYAYLSDPDWIAKRQANTAARKAA